MKGFSKKLKKIFIIGLVIYVSYIFVQQQLMLNHYRGEQTKYAAKMEEEKKKADELEKLELLYNTDIFLEKIAREKLGFVKPGEKVFIDMSNK